MRLSSTNLAILASTQFGTSTASSTCGVCSALARQLPGKVFLPNTTQYATSNIYWSDRQAEIHPACFITPESTEDVSTAIKILVSLSAPFTVKSGGHTAFDGGSNIQNGVTIDLARLNHLNVSDDRQTVSIGPGNRWIDVSEALDPLGLAVVGGRVGMVGVSGLILGGGISYFSGRYGWACDNVHRFEVVLASGDVVYASPDENADLFWALRGGGGSNFGVVTNFDLASFEQGNIWLHNRLFPMAKSTELVPAFNDLSLNRLPGDADGHTFLVMMYLAELGGYIIGDYLYHAQPPSDPQATPAVFASTSTITGTLFNSTTVANVTTHIKALSEGNQNGGRKAWFGVSVYLGEGSSQLLQDIIPLYQERSEIVLNAAASKNLTAMPMLVYQPITANILEQMQKNGGNALGLSPEAGPLVHIQVDTHWDAAELDEVVESSAADLVAKITRLAEERGLAAGYVYLNYADKNQDVYAGYGEESHARLREVAGKYDPEGSFRDLWRGYFEL